MTTHLPRNLTTLDKWTDICQSLYPSKTPSTSVHPIHSCIINGKRHYIHSPSLEIQDPSYFEQLKTFANKHGFRLSPDRRSSQEDKNNSRRKKLLPIIFLALGVNSGAVFADIEVERQSTSLSMLPHSHMIEVNAQSDMANNSPSNTSLPIDRTISLEIQSILASHFEAQADDPDTIALDMQALANYYSSHPEAIKLIESIGNSNWRLKYAPHTFQTDVKGSRMQVDEAVVYFDPRSGAKLKFYDKCASKVPFCVASPADALLHELLHVHSVLKDTSAFIADGGLNQYTYPAAHERKTILKENILYKSMSRRDNHPRPIRSEHTGRHVLVSCVTCVE